jgi:DNA-binding NarL/FixJ family response regulator
MTPASSAPHESSRLDDSEKRKSRQMLHRRLVSLPALAGLPASRGEFVDEGRRVRPWTKEEVRMLKMFARGKTKTVIARKLKRSVAAVYLRASKLAVVLGGGRGRKGA